jgi:ABC-2 type transport system permease protein
MDLSCPFLKRHDGLRFSGTLIGGFIGTFVSWVDHSRFGPNHLVWYAQPFFSVAVLQIFFLGLLFFLVATLSRRSFICR